MTYAKRSLDNANGSIMDYHMILDSCNYDISATNEIQSFTDRVDLITDHQGFDIKLNNIDLNGIHLKWGDYSSCNEKSYSIVKKHDTVVAHFCLSGFCNTENDPNLNVKKGQCLLFKEDKGEYHYEMGTENQQGSFFEVSMDTDLYANLFTGENELLDSIMDDRKLSVDLGLNGYFNNAIYEMHRQKENFSGKLKRLYLESKVMDLLLMQVAYYEELNSRSTAKLLSKDKEAIYQVKHLLDHTLQHTPIPELALSVGINQTKLKNGFKEEFGKSIFQYLTDIRMQKASELLKQTELSITEIAEMVGYKHVQHFSTAFKRVYGMLPLIFRNSRLSNYR